MAFLASFLDFLKKPLKRQSSPRINIIALESSPLGQMPLEIILYITRLLDPESAASFSLCCRSIISILAQPYLKNLQHEDFQTERIEFLKLLKRIYQTTFSAITAMYSTQSNIRRNIWLGMTAYEEFLHLYRLVKRTTK